MKNERVKNPVLFPDLDKSSTTPKSARFKDKNNNKKPYTRKDKYEFSEEVTIPSHVKISKIGSNFDFGTRGGKRNLFNRLNNTFINNVIELNQK